MQVAQAIQLFVGFVVLIKYSRHSGSSVMESPARLLEQLLLPDFANTSTGYAHEVQLMDFKNK